MPVSRKNFRFPDRVICEDFSATKKQAVRKHHGSSDGIISILCRLLKRLSLNIYKCGVDDAGIEPIRSKGASALFSIGD